MCPVVQQWYGARETSSGKFGPRKIVDCGRNLPQAAGGLPTIQKWHGAGDTMARASTRRVCYKKKEDEQRAGR
jgi:hypothetical protein